MKCEELCSILPRRLTEMIEAFPLDPECLQEIRIRVKRPLLAVCDHQEYQSKECVSRAQIGEILAYLSNYSLYAYEEEIRQGFLSLPGGHRVWISGRAVLEGGQVKTITDVSSLNIRFDHEVKG